MVSTVLDGGIGLLKKSAHLMQLKHCFILGHGYAYSSTKQARKQVQRIRRKDQEKSSHPAGRSPNKDYHRCSSTATVAAAHSSGSPAGTSCGSASLEPGTGRKCSESVFCWAADCCYGRAQSADCGKQKARGRNGMHTLKATRPMTMPAAKNAKAWMSQMTPQTGEIVSGRASEGDTAGSPCEGQQPQISANADASEPLTFRAIVSSIYVENISHVHAKTVFFRTDDIPEDVHAGHDADEEDLARVRLSRTTLESRMNRLTKNLSAMPPATNQKRTISPDMPRINSHVLHIHGEKYEPSSREPAQDGAGTHSQFRRAHQRVKRKKTARASDAILLAFSLKPHVMSAAPMSDDPR